MAENLHSCHSRAGRPAVPSPFPKMDLKSFVMQYSNPLTETEAIELLVVRYD